MSIQSEIDRIKNAKIELKAYLESKNIQVDDYEKIDEIIERLKSIIVTLV